MGSYMVWVPRGVDPATREVLVEGVPAYLKPALMDWIKPQVTRYDSFGSTYLVPEVFRDYDVVARPATSFWTRARGSEWPSFLWNLPAESLLDFVDWLVHKSGTDVRAQLASLLTDASSAWAIGKRNGNWGLVQRVPDGVKAAAEEASAHGTAGSLLAEAWAACFGRGPNPEEAYEKAIKAVEEAAASTVSPKNSRATLGTMIRDMRAQADWKLDLPGAARDVPVAMMEALWTGQESRHGGNGYRLPTQAESEAAVLLAVPLVQWFETRAISRRQ